MECKHDLAEREIAVTADGMCPFCMQVKIDELEGKKKTWFEKMVDEQKGTPLFEAEGKILELEEENYKLKKKIEELNTALDITTGALEGSQNVVKELEAKLVLHDRSQYEMINKQFLKQLNEKIEELEDRIESLNADLEHQRYKNRREEE